MSTRRRIETRESLSASYWDDLQRLVEHGELRAAAAQTVIEKMFESAPGYSPMLREQYWQTYLEEMRGDFSGRRLGAAAPWSPALATPWS